MADDLNETTLATLSHLASRLLRIEHVLHGRTAPSVAESDPGQSAYDTLQRLETRFAHIVGETRAYAELLKISTQHPDLFPSASNPVRAADELSNTVPIESQRAVVLAAASSFPATASALTSISDTPVPDPALSASLVALKPRMRAVEATQLAQAAEIAELRARSEVLIRAWYESGVMAYSKFVADIEGRTRAAENGIRRAEKANEEV